MLVDSHTHLLMLDVPPEEAVREAAEAGVGALVNIGTGVEDSREGARLASRMPNVYSAAGIHPHNAGEHSTAALETLAELAAGPEVVALGEVGLDYYRDRWPREVQRTLFEEVVSLADSLRMPLVIHSREAFDDTMDVLKAARGPVVLHCFEGGEHEIREASERGYYLGLAGNVTYKNSETARHLHLIDPERLLVETDAPYLSPQPVRGRPNAPKNVIHTARFVAGRLGVREEELAALTARNARDVFRLPLEL
ncbi:hypothetical protein RxyAA322_01670 [Rubrobacter xylanophilus]|uniref:Uncharacterized protein n=1 Tax=Rubrobacter xylanophilus TaxID=49319 RepID=A0A510HI28_9ACTN|nr:TatD family hydrolase [Rubrobacter xylanophilus]BBL78313.1 hypothetical protein RxyAA322_01670 [Rubrobacter xylanophilus]